MTLKTKTLMEHKTLGASRAIEGMMTKRIAHRCLLAASLLLAVSAYAVEFKQVVTEKSSIAFGYRQMNVPLEGKFKKFVAQLSFDPAKPEAANAKFDIDLSSIDTGSSEADDEVAGKAWFNAKAFPTAKFVSSSVKSLGGNRYQVQGNLTIKGKTLAVSTPVTLKADAASATFDGSFAIKRLDYAIGEGEWADTGTVANEVQIKFHIVTTAKP